MSVPFFFAVLAGILVCVIAGTLGFGYATKGDGQLFAAGFAAFVFVKLATINMLMGGHGVLGLPHWLGMPRRLMVSYAILLVPIAAGVVVSMTLSDQWLSLRVITVGLLLGWSGALVSWYLAFSGMTHYFNEVDVIKGNPTLTPEELKLEILRLRQEGLMSPEEEKVM